MRCCSSADDFSEGVLRDALAESLVSASSDMIELQWDREPAATDDTIGSGTVGSAGGTVGSAGGTVGSAGGSFDGDSSYSGAGAGGSYVAGGGDAVTESTVTSAAVLAVPAATLAPVGDAAVGAVSVGDAGDDAVSAMKNELLGEVVESPVGAELIGSMGAPVGDVGAPVGDVGAPVGDVGAPVGDVGAPVGRRLRARGGQRGEVSRIQLRILAAESHLQVPYAIYHNDLEQAQESLSEVRSHTLYMCVAFAHSRNVCCVRTLSKCVLRSHTLEMCVFSYSRYIYPALPPVPVHPSAARRNGHWCF
jgi:hypothetical protein